MAMMDRSGARQTALRHKVQHQFFTISGRTDLEPRLKRDIDLAMASTLPLLNVDPSRVLRHQATTAQTSGDLVKAAQRYRQAAEHRTITGIRHTLGSGRGTPYQFEIMRGDVQAKMMQLPEAMAAYGRAHTLNPNHTLTLDRQWRTLAQMGHFSEALKVLEAYVEHTPSFKEYHLFKAQLQHQAGRPRQALNTVRVGLKQVPNHPQLLRLRQFILSR